MPAVAEPVVGSIQNVAFAETETDPTNGAEFFVVDGCEFTVPTIPIDHVLAFN
jgi:hypothetical protein